MALDSRATSFCAYETAHVHFAALRRRYAYAIQVQTGSQHSAIEGNAALRTARDVLGGKSNNQAAQNIHHINGYVCVRGKIEKDLRGP